MQPARLPATEDELAEWSVYADWLITRGDPRGELIAFELTLPSEPTAEQLADFHARVSSQYRHRDTASVSWCLAHARRIELHDRSGDATDAGTIASALQLLASDTGRFVEHVGFWISELDRPARNLFRQLPPTCTKLSLHLSRRSRGLKAEQLIGIIPSTVRSVYIADFFPGTRDRPLDWFIDDRFDQVRFHFSMNLDAPAQFAERLAVTKRVKIAIADTRRARLASGEVWLPWERCAFGDPGDAVLVQPARNSAAIVPRWGLQALQDRYGPIPIRSQLASTLAENHGLSFAFDADGRPDIQQVVGSTLVRRGRSWTIRADRPHNMSLNGVRATAGQIVPIVHRDRITIETAECVFLTHDWESAVRYGAS
ncbi:MAG: hypothetical protein AB7O24_05620 [Kofleriaceae bacterium]